MNTNFNSNRFFTSINDMQNSIFRCGSTVKNERTDSAVKQLLGVTLEYEDPGLIIPEGRRVCPWVAAAELAWCMSTDLELSFLQKYTRMWDQFTIRDTNKVASNYGERWRKNFGRDQLYDSMLYLAADPSTRQALVMAWDPETDGCGTPSQPNVPCPIGFQISINGGELDINVWQRSMDAFVGAPYDFMMYSLLANVIKKTLGLSSSRVRFQITNVHLYEAHWDLISSDFDEEHYEIDADLRMVNEQPEQFVETVRDITKPLIAHRKNLKPEVVK